MRFICCCLLLLLALAAAALPRVMAACAHQFSVVIVRQATDSENGLRRYTCDLCGYTYTETIPSTGHLWGDWEVVKEPECGTPGEMRRACSKYPDSPHYEYKEIPATGRHDYVASIVKQPDCTDAGEKVYVCSICGDSYTESIPALGHDYGEWITDEQPTLLHEGSEHRVCSRNAAHIEEKVLEKLTLNMMDYVLSGIILLGTVGIGYPLLAAFHAINWYNNKKKEFLKTQGSR